MEWLGNRHAGEPSPARLLKIPSQKGVGEVGGEGVFDAADRVGSSILIAMHPWFLVFQRVTLFRVKTATVIIRRESKTAT